MQDAAGHRSNRQRSQETQALLIATGRELFVSQGYADTGTPQIVARAKVTRGALYHHFDGKLGLFHAVAQQAANEVAQAIGSGSANAKTPLDALLAGSKAYFAAMAAEDRAQLLLLEAPAVLSVDQVQALNIAAGGAELKDGLLAAIPHHATSVAKANALTTIVSAAFDAAALAIAQGGSRKVYEAAVNALLKSLACKKGKD